MVDCYQNQRGGHTKKDTTTDTSRKKLTLVIWTPKLEGFAFNTSAENVTSQRKKESKNITRVEERKKNQNKQALLESCGGVCQLFYRAGAEPEEPRD